MAMRVLLLVLLLAVRMELPGCGPFLPKTLFALSHQPERPETEFARGQLGVLLPGYTRDYLVVAYRHLTGVGLNDAARAALFPPPEPAAPNGSSRNPWLDARNRVAATTLERLSRQHGADSPEVKDWIAAQDQVFGNCAAGPAIPEPNGDPDRAYQVAAAKFYARQFDAARQDFEAIARDSASPWRGIAPYLVARCLIRKGDLDAGQQQLERVANDPALAQWHDAARRLMGYVRAKAHPAERLHELAGAVLRPDSPTLARDATDYHFLLDHLEKPPRDDDITDWILTFQSGTAEHAVEKWRETRSVPWLAAALARVPAGDAAAGDLLAAAREVKPGAPAYATVAFHAARLSSPAESRRIADAALAATLPVSARNLFRAERMRAATSLDEFLRFAARTAVGLETYEEQPEPKGGEYIDVDAARVLNRQVPLSLLKQASESTLLPEAARRGLRDVVWVRSVLFVPRPPSPDDVYRLLRSPGLKPYVDAGIGRYTPDAGKIDNFRDNWWCGTDTRGHWFYGYGSRLDLSDVLKFLYGTPEPAASFLSAGEQAAADAEWEKLKSIPTAPNWLAQQVLDWAVRTPDDPRLPEALHLAVRATRYGCTDQRNAEYSKRAWDLLHRRFPASEWAKKTPYWFQSER